MRSLPDFVISGEVARLIPVIADSRREQRVNSVFLATIAAIPDFVQPLLNTVGLQLGKHSVGMTAKNLKVIRDELPMSLKILANSRTNRVPCSAGAAGRANQPLADSPRMFGDLRADLPRRI